MSSDDELVQAVLDRVNEREQARREAEERKLRQNKLDESEADGRAFLDILNELHAVKLSNPRQRLSIELKSDMTVLFWDRLGRERREIQLDAGMFVNRIESRTFSVSERGSTLGVRVCLTSAGVILSSDGTVASGSRANRHTFRGGQSRITCIR